MSRYAAGFQLPANTDANHDALGFREVGRAGALDLPRAVYSQHQRDAYQMYQTLPLAHRYVTMIADHVVGPRPPSVEGPAEVVEVISEYFQSLGGRLHRWVRELSVFGEVHLRLLTPLPIFRGGAPVIPTRWGSLNPLSVEEVRTARGDVSVVTGVRHRGRKRALPALRLATPTKWAGEIITWRVNRLSHATRGHSDLMPLIDWLEQHEAFMFAAAEGARLRNRVIEHVTVQGGNESEVDRIRKTWAKDAKSGVSRFSNDVVKVEYLAPKLGSEESAAHEGMVKNHILAGMGIPPAWLGAAGPGAAGAVVETVSPTVRFLESRQEEVRRWLHVMASFVLAVARENGDRNISPSEFRIVLPEIRTKDTRQAAGVVSAVADSLVKGVSQGWIDKERAGNIYDKLMERLSL